MIRLHEFHLYSVYMEAPVDKQVTPYLKTECIFTDWLAARGEIQGNASSAILVVNQLADKEEKDPAAYEAWVARTIGSPSLGKSDARLPKVTDPTTGLRYLLLCSSAGLLKKASFYYVREDLWKDAMDFVWGDLDPFMVKAIPNKWLVYPGLLFSTATPADWSVDYSRVAVLPDVFNTVSAAVKRLVLPDAKNIGYPALVDENGDFRMNLTDGLVLRFVETESYPETCDAKMLASWLKKGLLKAYTIRHHFCKGLCVELPRQFLADILRHEGRELASYEVTDIFGNPHKLAELDLIMFESVFKMGSSYRVQFGKDGFAKWVDHAAAVTPDFYVCVKQHRNQENKFTAQPFQTMLGVNSSLEELYEARNLLEDYDSFKGIVKHWGRSLAKATTLFPNLAATRYGKEAAFNGYHDALWSLLKGNIPVGKEAAYLFVATDPVAVIQGMIGHEPVGCLRKNEICAPGERAGEVLLVRYPHPNANLVVADNVHINSLGMSQDIVWASAHDLTAQVLKMDFDGDHLQVITNQTMVSLAKQTNARLDQKPIVWDSPKGKMEICSTWTISRFAQRATQSSRVGIYADTLAKLWNGVREQELGKHYPLFCLFEFLINEDIDASKGGGDISVIGDWALDLVPPVQEAQARAYKKEPRNPRLWKHFPYSQADRGNLNAWNSYVLGRAKMPNGYDAKTDTIKYSAGTVAMRAGKQAAFWQLPADYPTEYVEGRDGQAMFDHAYPLRRVKGLMGAQARSRSFYETTLDASGNVVVVKDDKGFPIPACQWGKWAAASAQEFSETAAEDNEQFEKALSAQQENVPAAQREIRKWIAEQTGATNLSVRECCSIVAAHLYFFRGSQEYPTHWFRYFWQVFGDVELEIVRDNYEKLVTGTFDFFKGEEVEIATGKALPAEEEAELCDEPAEFSAFDDEGCEGSFTFEE